MAAGGTTAVLLNALSLINNKCEMYSVDLNKMHYKLKYRKTGFLADRIKKNIYGDINHKFYLGNTIASFIEKIGGDIDFLILDTAHFLPGELLDFITCLPYLKLNATVVLHDINYH